MPRPRRISDDQIAHAARETFLQHGPSAPVALVAEKLGVSHAALLQRVGSKEQLLLLTLPPGGPLLAAHLSEPAPSRGAARRLVELLLDLLAFLREMAPALVVLRSGGVPLERALGDREPPTVQLRRLLAAWLHGTGAIGRRRSVLLAEALLGTIEARCFNAHLGGERFVRGDERRLVRDLVAELVPELRDEGSPKKGGGRR